MSKEEGIPIFLFHPSLSSLSTRDSNKFQDQGNDQCELLCDEQGFIFGVINSEWQKKQSQPLTALIVSMLKQFLIVRVVRDLACQIIYIEIFKAQICMHLCGTLKVVRETPVHSENSIYN